MANVFEIGLCLTASTEHAIHLKSSSSSNFNHPDTKKYLSDLLVPLIKEVSRYNLPLPKLPSPSGGALRADNTEEDVFQGKVTVAWLHFLIGDYAAVLEKLPPEDESPKLTEGIGYEYTRVAVTKRQVLKGKRREMLGLRLLAGS